MFDLRKRKVLVHDNGDFTFLAQKLVEDFGETMYYTPWKSNFPRPEKAMIGEGLDGITNVMNFSEAKAELDPKRDLICFFDVGDADLQRDLRSQEYNVFGMGDAEILEMDRHVFKKELKKMGLPVIPYKHIVGIDNLEKYLQNETNKWVKITTYRGLMETFFVKDITHAESRLRNLRYNAGAYQHKLEFIVEDDIEGIEAGTDHFISDQGYFDKCLYGFEKKGDGYSAKIITVNKVPKPLRQILIKSIPYYKSTKPRGMFSTEARMTKDGIAYYSDATQRGGMPPSESICAVYKNFNEAIFAAAIGEKIALEEIAPYVAQIQFHSSWAKKESTVVEFPDKISPYIKLRNICKINGAFKYIPHDDGSTLGAAIGMGKTREEAEVNALEAADQVVADNLEYDKHCFDDLDEIMGEAKKIGMGDF